MYNIFNKKKPGLTLIEVILTLAIFSIVISLIYSINLFGLKSFFLSTSNAENQFEVRMPADFIAKHIRYANSIKISSTVPLIPGPGSHQIYLEDGEIIYKEYGEDSKIIGTSNVGDYSFTIEKAMSNTITYTIGKSGTNKFDLRTEVIGLNLDDKGVSGDESGIYVEYYTDNADSVDPVSIDSLINPSTQHTQIGSTISNPLRITANMSDGSRRQVAVNWNPSTIDTSTLGQKLSVGKVVGFPGTVNFYVYVGNYKIRNINDVSIDIAKNQVLNLPEKVDAEYSDSDGIHVFTQKVDVLSWEGEVDTSVPGTYELFGSVDGYADTVRLTVKVDEIEIEIISIEDINVTVNQGVTYALPEKVEAYMSDGSTMLYEVHWDTSGIDTDTPGIKVTNGTVPGYESKVILTIQVIQQNIPEPILITVDGDNFGSIKLTGLAGSEAIIRDKHMRTLSTGIIGLNEEVLIKDVKLNQAYDVILRKSGWLDSRPVRIN